MKKLISVLAIAALSSSAFPFWGNKGHVKIIEIEETEQFQNQELEYRLGLIAEYGRKLQMHEDNPTANPPYVTEETVQVFQRELEASFTREQRHMKQIAIELFENIQNQPKKELEVYQPKSNANVREITINE